MEEGTCPATPLHWICAPSLFPCPALHSISLLCFAQYFFLILSAVIICLALHNIYLSCKHCALLFLGFAPQHFYISALSWNTLHKSCLHFVTPQPLALICFLILKAFFLSAVFLCPALHSIYLPCSTLCNTSLCWSASLY